MAVDYASFGLASHDTDSLNPKWKVKTRLHSRGKISHSMAQDRTARGNWPFPFDNKN
jgi:hypothetical protein